MNADTRGLKHKELTEMIIGVFYDVYSVMAFSNLCMRELSTSRLPRKVWMFAVRSQCPVWFRGRRVGDFTADLLVERCVLLELKAVRTLDSAHEAQLLNYLRATDIEVGLLFNFGIKPEFKRLAFENSLEEGSEGAR